MTLSLAGTFGALVSVTGAVTALVVALRKSKSESDDSWQARVREQLEWQIERNKKLDEAVAVLRAELDAEREARRALQLELAAERADRRRTEAEFRGRIVELEARLRQYES